MFPRNSTIKLRSQILQFEPSFPFQSLCAIPSVFFFEKHPSHCPVHLPPICHPNTMSTPFDAETALALSQLLNPEAYNRILENQILPAQFSRLTHSEWTELGIPIGIRHRIIDLVELAPSVDDATNHRRGSLLGGTPTPSPSISGPTPTSSSSAPQESTAHGFTFKEALATVPHFSGALEEDVVSWLQEIMTLVGDAGMAAKVARSKLSGKPKEWLASLKSPVPATAEGWTILSASLKSLYGDPLRTRSALEDLKSLKWLPLTSITDHCVSIVTLLEKAEIREEDARIDHLINSVPPSARQFLILSGSSTMEDAIQKLKLWERTTDFTPYQGSPSANASSSTPARRCFICQDPTHLASFHKRRDSRRDRPKSFRPICPTHKDPRSCNGCDVEGHRGHCNDSCLVQHPNLRPPPRTAAVAIPDSSLNPNIAALMELLNHMKSPYLSHKISNFIKEKKLTGYPTPNPPPDTSLNPLITPDPQNSPSPVDPKISTTSFATTTFRPLPECSVLINNSPTSALIDSGSQISLIRRNLAQLLHLEIGKSSIETFRGVDGKEILAFGQTSCSVQIGKLTKVVNFTVVESTPAPILLGVDAIESFGLVINLRKRVLTSEDGVEINLTQGKLHAVCATSAVLQPYAVENVPLMKGASTSLDCLYFPGFCSDFLFIAPGIINSQDPRVLVVNRTAHPYRLRYGRELGDVEHCAPIPESVPIQLNPPSPAVATSSLPSNVLEKIKFGSTDKGFMELASEFAEIFSPISGPADLPPMPIELEDPSQPIVTRPHSREPLRHTPWLRDTVDQMLSAGIVKHSHSAFHSPVVIVRKPNGRGWRLCVDYRAINSKTKPIFTVLPDPEAILSSVRGFKYMSSVDLTSGFWQLAIVPEHTERTAFSTSFGAFEYLAAPMGLRNVPHHFNRAITSLFKPEIDEGFLKTYFDDLNVFSQDVDTHLQHLRRVFAKCRDHNIKINPEKCFLAVSEGPCLGFIISGDSIRPSTVKAQAIVDMPEPTSVNEIRVFMGLVNFYRRFIPNLARLAAPLTGLTKKNVEFQWSANHQKAFKEIKSSISSSIALHHFNPSAGATVTSDASEKGWAASLSQNGDIIAFASGTFTSAQSKYAPHERECLGAISGLEKFRHYLLGGKVTLITDSKALAWLQKSKELSPKLFRWSLRLQEFAPEIIHKEGTSIPAEDCGSRLPADSTNLSTDLPSSLEVHPSVANTGSTPLVSVQTRSQLKSILRNEDPANFNGKQRYSENPTPPENTQTVAQNDQSQTNQPQSVQLTREEWLHRAHAHPLAGHFGEQATLLRLKDFTSWPGMEQDVADLVRSCRCQLTKSYPRLKPSHGFSQSFHFCEKIGIDFLGPFPPTPRNNRYIFVLNEMFSNSLLAIPCTRADLPTAEFYIRFWISQYDVPTTLISDHHIIFDGPSGQKLWQELGIRKVVTAPHHQSSNGATERSVGTLKNRLRTLCSSPNDWDLKLFDAITAINHSPSLQSGLSPFEIRFARYPRGSFHPLEPFPSKELAASAIDSHLRLRRSRIADEYAKSSPRFQPGNLVKIKEDVPKHFTSPLWKGPFKVAHASSHFVTVVSPNYQIIQTHVDKIAPFTSPPGYVFGAATPVSPTSDPAPPTYEVEEIIGHRISNGKILYLTKWVGFPASQATYEPAEHFSKIALLTNYNKKSGLTTPVSEPPA